MSRVSVTCTELVRSSRSKLLPGGNSNKGLWMPQGPMPTNEVIQVVSPIEEPGSGTLPRFHQARGKGDFSIKRTYQPKKRYRRRVHGFLRRMSTKGGARLIQNRRRKGRHRLTP
jgi:large subunit ribosomal protein L34